MSYKELPSFIAKVEGKTETIGLLALLFAIFTAVRNGEVREAKWSQIDFEAGEWFRPASMMRKNGEAHVVTLSPEALAILERAKPWRTSDGIAAFFPTFRTWAAERITPFPDSAAESALAYKIPNAVVRAYNRAKFKSVGRCSKLGEGMSLENARSLGLLGRRTCHRGRHFPNLPIGSTLRPRPSDR